MQLRTLLIGMAASFISVARAQDPVWESGFDNKADFLFAASHDEKYIVGTTKKDICVPDGKTGKKIWGDEFKNLAKVKRCESRYYMQDAGVLFLSDKKAGKDQILATRPIGWFAPIREWPY